jgi:hypothetical protein
MMRVTVVSGGRTVVHNRVAKILDYDWEYVYVHDLDLPQRVRYPLTGTTMAVEAYKESHNAADKEAGS